MNAEQLAAFQAENAALQQRMVAISAQENAGRINRFVHDLPAIEKKLDAVAAQQGLVVASVADFMQRQFPPRENLLEPWLPTQGLVMLYAPRGTGKTHASLGIAYAVAAGAQFLRWNAAKPAGVLFVDGELPANLLQERLALVVKSFGVAPRAPLDILTPDLQPFGAPDVSTEEGQLQLEAMLKPEHQLIVLDSLTVLARSGKENEGEAWLPVQNWALRQRAAGRSVLFIHHSGKGGQQRGTSRREDLLDTVIALRRPPDYREQDGASFCVHFEKARQLHGDVVSPFEARLETGADGRPVWTTRSLEESTYERVCALHADGLKPREITEELGIHRSQVSRHLKRMRGDETLQ